MLLGHIRQNCTVRYGIVTVFPYPVHSFITNFERFGNPYVDAIRRTPVDSLTQYRTKNHTTLILIIIHLVAVLVYEKRRRDITCVVDAIFLGIDNLAICTDLCTPK